MHNPLTALMDGRFTGLKQTEPIAMPATRDDLFARLAELGIETTTKDHAAVYTVEEARARNLPIFITALH